MLVLGYVDNKLYDKSLDLFEKMSLAPHETTFTIIFDACAHLVTDRAKGIGNKLVEGMSKNYRNCSYVMNCAINMFMKFGDVKSAENLFQQVSKRDIVTYGAMMKGKLIHIFYLN